MGVADSGHIDPASTARDDAISKALEGFGDELEPLATDGIDADAHGSAEDASQDVQQGSGQEPDHDDPNVPRADSQGQTDEQAVAATTQLDAPKNWPKERREAFSSLSDDAKRIILDREKEFNKGFTKQAQEIADHRKFSESVRGLFTDSHRAQMEQAGIDELHAISQLVQLHDHFSRDPAGYIRFITEQSGLTPEQIFQISQVQPSATEAQAAEDDEWVDPYLKRVKSDLEQRLEASNKRLEEAQAKIYQLEQAYTGDQRARQNYLINSMQKIEDQFVSETDENGNLRYPHFNEVYDDMVQLIQTKLSSAEMSPREKLEKAYEMAVYLNPDLRTSFVETELEKRMAEREKNAAVNRARQARTIKGGAGSSGTASAGKMQLDEAISQAFRDAGI